MRVRPCSVPTVTGAPRAAVGLGVSQIAVDLRVVWRHARILAGFLRVGTIVMVSHVLWGNGGCESTAATGVFGQWIDDREANKLLLAWGSVPGDDVPVRALEFAQQVAPDQEVARTAAATFGFEPVPPSVSSGGRPPSPARDADPISAPARAAWAMTVPRNSRRGRPRSRRNNRDRRGP